MINNKTSKQMTIKKKYEMLRKKLKQANNITKKPRQQTTLTDKQIWHFIT